MTDKRLTVTVTAADRARDPYLYVPFDVPEGTTRIDVVMAYDKADDCVIDLGVVDPRITPYPSSQGFRGWSGGARDRFFVATDDATPGYVHGEMPAGLWKVMLGLYKVPAAGTQVELTISTDAAARPVLAQPERTHPVRRVAGWYRGDLHCHTWHSDARGAPEVLHAAARQAGLDFLAVADHNTTTQRRYFHPHSSADLVFIRAMEVTTAEGHANVFGVDDWIDFRMTRPEDAHTLAEMVHGRGGLLSVNHDKPPIPWDYELPDIDCMEVWQSAWPLWNWVSLARYQERLASGRRISAIGSSDYHQPEALQPEGPLVLARPTTVVWLEELSEDAVLAALKAGHCYVTESPDGPHLEITAEDRPMGASLTKRPIQAQAHVRGAMGDRLAWWDGSGLVCQQQITTNDWTGYFAGVPRGFLRAEIVAEGNRDHLLDAFRQAVGDRPLPDGLREADILAHPIRRALSNPIYIEG